MTTLRKLLLITAIVILFAGLIGPGAIQASAVEYHAHPALLDLAAQAPQTLVSVIVQKNVQSNEPEQQAEMLGGKITKDLSIINAFAAQMAAVKARDLSESPFVKWVSLDSPVKTSSVNPGRTPTSPTDGSGTTTGGTPSAGAKFTTWADRAGTAVATTGFTSTENMLNLSGPDKIYATGGSKAKMTLAGFVPEYSPGNAIARVEVAVRIIVPITLGSSEYIKFSPYLAGKAVTSKNMTSTAMSACANACTLYLDITAGRVWKWSEISALQLVIDQTYIASGHTIDYDAVGIRVSSGPGSDSGSPITLSAVTSAPLSTTVLTNQYNKVVRAPEVWNEAPGYYQGQNITVAVVDSGSFKSNGLGNRLVGVVNFNSADHISNDQYGHGTHVAGIIADNGISSSGKYIGMAPKVNILAVRVADDQGASSEADVINALQWIYNNKATYNIRVVNLSLNSAAAQSYQTSPLDAACEILWFNGITVVVSAGNNGTADLFPPANDPFVITVGAINDGNTVDPAAYTMGTYSAYGTEETGGTKPDLVAPGSNLIAYLPDTTALTIPVLHPDNVVTQNYFRMSGTSMAAPVVSGAVAVLLSSNPNMTPDQVKYRLEATANKNWTNYDPAKAGSGLLDLYAAVHGTTTQSANTGVPVSSLLTTGTSPVNSSVAWNSVAWNSVAWNSVAWNSVAWNSVAWNSVAWNSDYWDN